MVFKTEIFSGDVQSRHGFYGQSVVFKICIFFFGISDLSDVIHSAPGQLPVPGKLSMNGSQPRDANPRNYHRSRKPHISHFFLIPFLICRLHASVHGIEILWMNFCHISSIFMMTATYKIKLYLLSRRTPVKPIKINIYSVEFRFSTTCILNYMEYVLLVKNWRAAW